MTCARSAGDQDRAHPCSSFLPSTVSDTPAAPNQVKKTRDPLLDGTTVTEFARPLAGQEKGQRIDATLDVREDLLVGGVIDVAEPALKLTVRQSCRNI